MARGRGPNYVANAQQRVAAARARARGRGRTAAGKAGRGKANLGGPSPLPFDSQAERESAELGNEASDTRASLAAKYAAAQNELGFGDGAANPYSRSAENKTDLTNNARGITNTAGNQLYAGSTANKQSSARSEYDKNQKALEDSYAQAQAAYTRGVGQTGRDEALGDATIKEGAIGRAAASEPAPLAVGKGKKGVASGRGRVAGPGADGRNVRRPNQARANNARARAINARVSAGRKGRGRV